ncbi:hypothetical protein A3D00_04425 [Candidatus Woesebacteria bacterium RIFCSPHIGHO2_02_FULL_38_9]|uniref:Uncharacterized protein n=1 Tax=Candidatus Woesebacteria bacterium RIFCSPHIGHO2_01_FULL_39_28 TaxID=1802496 RepID=A0A1F7YIM2_9BACT|nr:MAG: hypothetical protein A2627_05780 [Candidatus Woesebacteria bacterium RIFCSPHIGHO2_01_FULL_39_28]OGM34937.1 MAG: hypothetical protein A3D00_04425 [Candidatus Woesebacteria bacterium RIFCSPHIGHO2_02_FULL_38_9]OGM57460.1 MAG: hypothetical protein A3A50_06025 [Candidatus Woesebacteria bacterium RIFCSPLOWO2_01_FULL_38_20]
MDIAKKHFLVVALLWIFAPMAWVLMWQDKRYHTWFPTLLWINGIIFTIVFTTQAFLILPKLTYFYAKYNIHSLPRFNNAIAIFLIIFAVFQIIFGFHLKKKIQKKGKILDHYMGIIFVILSLDFLLGILTGLLSLLLPVNKMTFSPR